MEEHVKILRCLKCGRKVYLYQESTNEQQQYFIKCDNCGSRTPDEYQSLEVAIAKWNEINTPKSTKPTYHCGNCGEEVYLGAAECSKCGVGVEW